MPPRRFQVSSSTESTQQQLTASSAISLVVSASAALICCPSPKRQDNDIWPCCALVLLSPFCGQRSAYSAICYELSCQELRVAALRSKSTEQVAGSHVGGVCAAKRGVPSTVELPVLMAAVLHLFALSARSWGRLYLWVRHRSWCGRIHTQVLELVAQ